MEKTGRSKKEAREEKLKGQRLEDLILKTLEECPNPEEKIKMLLRRNVDAEKKLTNLCNDIKTQQRYMELQQREKEQMQRELNKSVLMRDKLQEVCREQQKIIKSVKNESLLKIREEEERRKENQLKFQTSLNEITQSVTKNNEENLKLRDYNVEITKKLKYLSEQYKAREEQMEKLNEQIKLESQLHQAKLNKVQVEATMEKEILTKENQIGLEKLLHAQQMIKELTGREQVLKEQLNIYTSKYDEFQKSLQKSNEIFANYKAEIEKMSKQNRKLEREVINWRTKYEKNNAITIELATEKQARDEHAERCNKQVDQLQKLLRALQSERTNLYKTLRDNKIEIPPMPALPEEPEPMKIESINGDRDKMELMSRNCEQLKETLANLQNQMKLLSTMDSKEKSIAAKQQQQQQQLQMKDEKNDEAVKIKKNKKKNKKANKKNNKNDVTPEDENANAETEIAAENVPERVDVAVSVNESSSPPTVEDAENLSNGFLTNDHAHSNENLLNANIITEVEINKDPSSKDDIELLDTQSAPALLEAAIDSLN